MNSQTVTETEARCIDRALLVNVNNYFDVVDNSNDSFQDILINFYEDTRLVASLHGVNSVITFTGWSLR